MNAWLRRSKTELTTILHAAVLYVTTFVVLELLHRARGDRLFVTLVDGGYVSFDTLECFIMVSALLLVFARRLQPLGALKGSAAVAAVSAASTTAFFHAARIFARM